LHPDILPIEDKKTWEYIQKNSVLNLFQFDSLSGSQGIKKVKPKNIQELADTNGLIRLTAGEGMELPMDKYVRFKNNLNLWYEEMDRYGLTKEEQEAVTPYFKPYYGVPISQEVLMKMVMDERLCGFSLKEANELRKVLAKKKLQEIPVMKEKILTRAKSPNLGRYVWEAGAGPQMSYSFSVLHATAYSYIGFQTAYLSSHWHPIYWATACLIVNSGSLEE
jgi:DNA polymerase-3 subunit alpha